MSGLEILGAFASSVAVVQALQGTIKIVNVLRKVGEIQQECDKLKEEIELIHGLHLEAQKLTEPLPHEPSESNKYPLIELTAQQLKEIGNQLNNLLGKCTKDTGGDVRVVRKLRWIKEKQTINMLRNKAQKTRENLQTAVNFRNSLMLNTVKTRQDVLIEMLVSINLDQQATQVIDNTSNPEPLKSIENSTNDSSIGAIDVALRPKKPHGRSAQLSRRRRKAMLVQEDNSVTVTTIQPISSRTYRCWRNCKCRCHWNEQKYQSGSWVQPLLGSWMVGFRGIRKPVCSESECQRGGDGEIQFQYQLPQWLWAGVVSFQASYNGKPNPGFSLRLSKTMSIYDELWNGVLNPLSLRRRIENGLGLFPDDSFETGHGMMEVAIHQEAYESVRILLQAWGNLLPKQGLPRRVRYRIKFQLSNWYLKEEEIELLQQVQKYTFVDDDEQGDRSTRVHDAVADESSGLVRVLQDDDQRWAIDEFNDMGQTPLHLAIIRNRVEAVKQLVVAGADVNKLDWVGETPLMLAAMNSNLECMQALLQAKECVRQINRQKPNDGRTALHFAVELAAPEVVALLLKAGASVTVRDKWGRTPLHQLAPSRKDAQEAAEIVRLLCSNHADLNAADIQGFTPILSYVQQSNLEALRPLVDAGGSLQNIDTNSFNILHLAARRANVHVLNYLASLDLTGVDPTLSNVYGQTPWDAFCDAMRLQDWQLADKLRRPDVDEQHAFGRLFYHLLSNHLQSDISVLKKLLVAFQQKNSQHSCLLLSTLIHQKEAYHRQDLVNWYRGIQGYITDQSWELAMEDIQWDIDDMIEHLNDFSWLKQLLSQNSDEDESDWETCSSNEEEMDHSDPYSYNRQGPEPVSIPSSHHSPTLGNVQDQEI